MSGDDRDSPEAQSAIAAQQRNADHRAHARAWPQRLAILTQGVGCEDSGCEMTIAQLKLDVAALVRELTEERDEARKWFRAWLDETVKRAASNHPAATNWAARHDELTGGRGRGMRIKDEEEQP